MEQEGCLPLKQARHTGGNVSLPFSVWVTMVSVIITTYNRAQLVLESIYSVLNQTWKDLELIVVDDGSTDHTSALIDNIPDPRLRYYKLPHCGRTAILKNFAIRQAKGSFIAFNDSDDTWEERKLEKQVQLLLQHPGLGFSITDVINYAEGRILSRTWPGKTGIECANIFGRMKLNRFVVFTQTMVIRRACFDTTGLFDETIPFGSDYHFNMRLAFYFDAGIIYEGLLWRFLHNANESNLVPVEYLEGFVYTFEYLFRHNMVSKKYLDKAKSHAFLQIGHLFKQQKKLGAARHHYRQSLKYNLLQPACYWQLLKTCRAKGNFTGQLPV